MKQRRADMRLLRWSMVALGLMSLSFLLMVPQEQSRQAMDLMTILAGLCFWLPFLAGLALQLKLWAQCRKHYKTHRQPGKPAKRVGVICFFRNPVATVWDIVMFVAVAALVISLLATNGSGAICFLFFSITMFAFCGHCVYNGRSYFFITCGEAHKRFNRRRVRTQPDQSKEKFAEKGEDFHENR